MTVNLSLKIADSTEAVRSFVYNEDLEIRIAPFSRGGKRLGANLSPCGIRILTFKKPGYQDNPIS
jgi:hypothetical protein